MNDLFPLQVRGAVAKARGRRLIGPIDLDLEGRGACVVLGPNGSGKTTLLKLLHGLVRLGAGKITWKCHPETARQKQAFVFQRPIMLRRSVLDNLAFPLRLRNLDAQTARKDARDWSKRFYLEHLLDLPATHLSGGEQQKLAIARALISSPKLLLLDEPTASLDGRATQQIERILEDTKSNGTEMIFSTHDLGQARRLAKNVVFLLNGKVHETAPADMFFERPSTAEARAFLRGDIVA